MVASRNEVQELWKIREKYGWVTEMSVINSERRASDRKLGAICSVVIGLL